MEVPVGRPSGIPRREAPPPTRTAAPFPSRTPFFDEASDDSEDDYSDDYSDDDGFYAGDDPEEREWQRQRREEQNRNEVLSHSDPSPLAIPPAVFPRTNCRVLEIPLTDTCLL